MITPAWYPTRRQLRLFALVSLLGMAVIGVVIERLTGSSTASLVVWGFGLLLAVVGLPFPDAIRLPYVVIMAVTLPVGWLISNLLLRIIYYGVFTPLGLAFRLAGRDPLLLKRPRSDSYWRKYRARGDVAGYYRQS
jgi:hypothetical protein